MKLCVTATIHTLAVKDTALARGGSTIGREQGDQSMDGDRASHA